MLNTSLLNQRLVNAGPTLASIFLVGVSDLFFDAYKIKGGIISLTGENFLTVDGKYMANGFLRLKGESSVIFNGGKLQKAMINLLGKNQLNVGSVRRRFGLLMLNGEWKLVINGSRVLLSSIDYIGDSVFRTKGVSTAFFISSDGQFRPLGVYVLGDSRKGLLPAIREYSERIPGKHGEILFDTKLDPRIMELYVATGDGLQSKEQVKRNIARYLNPTVGDKTLIFADDLDKIYNVRYSGNIPLTQYADWFEFTIPFRLKNPYIIETFEQLLTGSGTITNKGNVETFLTIEVKGPVSNPTLIVGGAILAYTGTLNAGQVLTIDTEKRTAKIIGVNALDSYNGVFPRLPIGNTPVIAGNNVTFKWKGRWI